MDALARHRLQMTRQERVFLDTFIRKLRGWNLDSNPHLETRLQEKQITREQVIEALASGIVLEVKSNGRFLVRLDTPSAPSTCVVVDVPRRTVVTVWRNNPGDHHATLNMSAYTWRTTGFALCESLTRNL